MAKTKRKRPLWQVLKDTFGFEGLKPGMDRLLLLRLANDAVEYIDERIEALHATRQEIVEARDRASGRRTTHNGQRTKR